MTNILKTNINLELVSAGRADYATETKPRTESTPSNPDNSEYTCYMDNGQTKKLEIGFN